MRHYVTLLHSNFPSQKDEFAWLFIYNSIQSLRKVVPRLINSLHFQPLAYVSEEVQKPPSRRSDAERFLQV